MKTSDVNKKICFRCNRLLSLDNFYPSQTKGKPVNHCKECSKNRRTLRRRTTKEKSVEYKGGKCEICGYDKCIAALEFHHINPEEKDSTWVRMMGYTFSDLIKKELDKCQLLCANCHREVHYKEKEKDILELKKEVDKERTEKRKDQSPNTETPREHNVRTHLRKFDISREELHKLVWSMPTVEVAKILEVSDTAVGRRCKLLSIPKPPRGFWRKLQVNLANGQYCPLS